MRFSRSEALLSLLSAGALVLSGCGGHSDTAQSTVQCGGKKVLHASGATAQENAIAQFVYAYVRACPGNTLDYNANGSGKGVEEFVSNVTDLAGSGVPLDPSKGEPERATARCGSPAWDLPAVFEPIAVTYNLNGVNPLKLDATTLAKIFNGGITKWDDPAIKALNASINLPSVPIHVIYRSDKSANSANFQQYLDAASNGAWGKGGGEKFNGGVGDGAAGDEGSSGALQSTDGGITYNEWSFAVGKQLSMAQIITSAGPDPVSITTDSVGKTIAGATFKGQGNDLVLDTSSFYKPTQSGAYPIVEPTYEIVCSKYPDSATGLAVKAFMQAAVGPGQDGLDQYGSIPLPKSFQSKLAAAVDAIA
ncbi:phosphate ABC transporter substrate-binding protein PstS [Mycobacterium sp. E2733]|uniref:phosphate ABC transporter substrate-binding protein PstS n=1 Tax=Mycobacterium sp. E2733 TaxID=1834138 RepID=UPI000800369D|nr:phosphate ABC transporter substrate-binding protein PstS [Mycobacterium sp. E2733]OBH90506.1 phosphate ABC transporter substrate-binding protein PstS [Mycobacterium sp. E2733]